MTDFVEYAGVRFEGSSFAELTYSNLAGWDGIPEGRGGGDSIPGGHGVYARTEVLRESRAIVLTANLIADSAERFFELKRMLEALPPVGELRVDQGDGAWSRQVDIQHMPIPDFHTRTVTEFTIDMIAPDPVRYRDPVMLGPVGLPVRSGGLRLPERFPWNFGTSIMPVLKLVNGGTRPTFPIVTVTGAGSALTVMCGPRRIEFGAWSGEFVIDNRDRRAFLNGADVTRGLIRREWQEIPAGGSWDLTYDVADADPATQMFATYQEGAW